MSDAAPGISLPTPEHVRLKDRVATWDVDCTYFLDATSPPMKARATETSRLLGELWVVSDFDSDMMGVPFHGHATVGYDPTRRLWTATWVDTMTPSLFVFEGEYDASQTVLSMTAEAPDFASGQMSRYRTREELEGRDQRTLEMFVSLPDGGEFQISHLVYRRRT